MYEFSCRRAALAVALFGLLGYGVLLSADSEEFASSADTLNRRAQSDGGQFDDPKTVEPRVRANIMIDYAADADGHLPFEMCPFNKNEFALYAKWRFYRLSDILKGQQHRASGQLRAEYAQRYGPHTIVDDYFAHLEKNAFTRLSPEVLYEVLKPRLMEARNDVAVLHLRTGDVTCSSCWTETSFKRRNGDNYPNLHMIYVYNKMYYEQILKSLKERAPQVTSIVIAAATIHDLKTSPERRAIAAEEVKQVRDLFEEHGYRVTQRINCGTPDEDFVFMASQKYFIEGGGGYSRDIADVVELNGGQVFFDKEYLCHMAEIPTDGHGCHK